MTTSLLVFLGGARKSRVSFSIPGFLNQPYYAICPSRGCAQVLLYARAVQRVVVFRVLWFFRALYFLCTAVFRVLWFLALQGIIVYARIAHAPSRCEVYALLDIE